MKDQVGELIEIINDPKARKDEVSDALMYLGEFNDDRALKALIQYALTNAHFLVNSNDYDSLMDNCAESIADIWIARNHFDEKNFKRLPGFIRGVIRANVIAANKHEWSTYFDTDDE